MATHYQIIYDSSLSVKGVDDANKITLGVTTSVLKVDSYELYLKKIDYDKKMYHCGKVTLTFQTSSAPANLSTFRTSLETFVAKNNKISVTVGQNYLALGYDIYSAKIQTSLGYSGTTLTNIYEVVMQCYSPEHKYAIFNGSHAWTGKPFAGTVVRNTLEDYSDSSDDSTSGFPTCSTLDTSTNHCILDVAGLSSLKYSNSSSTAVEANQPYLVQYNETFYDFACRVANRCGEFLYHEDGCFRIGLPKYTYDKISAAPTSSTTADNSTGKPQPLIEFGEIVNNPNVPDIYSDNYYDDSTYGTVGTYDGNVTDDAYLRRLDSSKDKPQGLFDWWMLIDAINSYLQEMIFQDSLSEMITNVATNVTESAILQGYASKDFNKTFFTSEDLFNSGLGLDKDQLTKFSDTLKNAFYEKKRRQMIAQTGKMVNLNYQNTMHSFHLGQCVYITDLGMTWHIVTRIHGSLSKTSPSDKGSFQHDVEIIPVDGSTAVPPIDNTRSNIHKAEPQEAVVVDTADPLFMGRIRVRYMWQPKTVHATTTEKKDGKTTTKSDSKNLVQTEGVSPWIRVATPFAGAKGVDVGGMCMTPYVGTHVMVNYLHDNIEMPYVDGALYTYSTKPGRGYMGMLESFLLPSNGLRTIGSGSGHNITFVDGVDAQNFLNGMLPLVKMVWGSVLQSKFDTANREKTKTDEDETVEAATPTILTGGMVLKDELGIYEINMSTQNRNITINSPIGNIELNAFTGITISAPNGDVNITGKNVNITAGNNLSLKSGAHIQSPDTLDGASISGLVGSCMGKYVVAAAKAALTSATKIDVSKLCDLRFLRAVTETIFRPVEGSLRLQSNRNVVMTSGKGMVTIPKSLMSAVTKYHIGKKSEPWNETNKAYKMNVYQKVVPVLRVITLKIRERLTAVQNASDELKAALNGIERPMPARVEQFGKDDKKVFINAAHYDSIVCDPNRHNPLTVEEWFKPSALEDYDLGWKEVGKKKSKKKKSGKKNSKKELVMLRVDATDIPTFVAQINNAMQKYQALMRAIHGLGPNDAITSQVMNLLPVLTSAIKDIVARESDTVKDFGASFAFQCNIHPPSLAGGVYSFNLDTTIDDIIKEYLYGVIKSSPLFDQKQIKGGVNDWATFVDSITPKPDDSTSSFFKSLGSELGGFVGLDIDTDGNSGFGKLVNWNGQAGPRAMWEAGGDGGILLSNNAGKTYKLKKDGTGWEPIDNPGLNVLKDFLINQNSDMVQRISEYVNDI